MYRIVINVLKNCASILSLAKVTVIQFVHTSNEVNISSNVYAPYLLTPWNRVLLEKLTGPQLVKKFPAFYGTQKFITSFTSSRQLSLS
jgi:hypothetical protein